MSDDIKKGGLIITQERETDYPFLGGKIGANIILPNGDWTKYLPTPEKQATMYFDPWSCVSESLTNIIETHIYRLMEIHPEIKSVLEKLGALDENGRPNFSGRFLAVLSGTVPGRGNSFDAVLDAFRSYGLVGEKIWPKTENMSQSEYYAQIPQEIIDKGKEFFKYFTFGYEKLPYSNDGLFVKYADPDVVKEALKYSPIWGAVDANWSIENGLYGYFGAGKAISYNHAIMEQLFAYIFDTYDPFVKQLVSDYKIGYPKRFHFEFKQPNGIYKKKGSPACYLYLNELDTYFPIADTVIKGIKIDGGTWFKLFCGEYSNAKIKTLDEIPENKIEGDIKPNIGISEVFA